MYNNCSLDMCLMHTYHICTFMYLKAIDNHPPLYYNNIFICIRIFSRDWWHIFDILANWISETKPKSDMANLGIIIVYSLFELIKEKCRLDVSQFYKN